MNNLVENLNQNHIAFENARQMVRSIESLLTTISEPGTYSNPIELQCQLPKKETFTLQITIPPVEALLPESPIVTDEDRQKFEPIVISIMKDGKFVANRAIVFDRLPNGSLLQSSTITTMPMYQGYGIGRSLVTATELLIPRLRTIFPEKLAQKDIVSWFQDINTTDTVSASQPLRNGWADKYLKSIGYTFEPNDVMDAVSTTAYGFDLQESPYKSRVKIYKATATAATPEGAPPAQTEIQNLETPLVPEVIKGVKYFNFSGKPLNELVHLFPPNLGITQVVIHPDFSPSGEPGVLPTGSVVTINTQENPRWREITKADIGCGMHMLDTNMTFDQFTQNHHLFDELAEKLLSIRRRQGSNLGDLGGGNHFVDAVVNYTTDLVSFVIHTGSRNESKRTAQLVSDPTAYDTAHTEAISWARQNRETIASFIQNIYKGNTFTPRLDNTHNFYHENPDNHTVTIYKGAVKLNPGTETIVPSSMNGDMVLLKGTKAVAEIGFAVPHGTGRLKSRGTARRDLDLNREAVQKILAETRQHIYIPDVIPSESFLTERPDVYRRIDDCLALISDLVEEVDRYAVVGFIGGQ